MRKLTLPFVFISVAFLVAACHEGGVRVSNNMEKYAVEYLNENNLLDSGETVLAFYDCTISLDASEFAMVTDKRVVYHKKDVSTTSIKHADIRDIKHTDTEIIGHTIQVYANDGSIMMIEIAKLNNGDTFVDVLNDQWMQHILESDSTLTEELDSLEMGG